MTTLREAAQQALEALEKVGFADARRACDEAVGILRAALVQQEKGGGNLPPPLQAEPVQEPGFWGRVAARQASRIKQLEITAQQARQAEPVREPVAWMFTDREGTEFFEQREDWDGWWTPLYTAPPQRQPLTDEEILKAIGWERAEMYMKLTPNFPVAEAKKETLKNARAIERAHGIVTCGDTKERA